MLVTQVGRHVFGRWNASMLVTLAIAGVLGELYSDWATALQARLASQHRSAKVSA